ncbi:hypothetical protein [Paenibacillus arenosi]|uniref:Uncharacterized protein n=1 Tax=Paenibacillus arenosi TaxID=2774142 RepID=A0ABR9AYW1_9BACL|nr:hypothetical protein [Paenibacillus arenosi]MBD8498878.1 hypothetical protein [Paenibacillus arenosi]
MAGTRGIARFRGEQLNQKIMRNHHFDEAHKISETYLNINFHNHREVLEDTKVDVFVQANNKTVAGVAQLDVSADVGSRAVSTGINVEGVVLTEKVQIRAAGTDTPIGDVDADVVYGRLEEAAGVYTLKFYSLVSGVEQPYTFPAGVGNIDYRFVVRTNLSVFPVDSIIKGGAGFVEGATDAKAYMNLIQLMKDVYGASGTLDNDGNANLPLAIQDQINKEVQDRLASDQAAKADLAAAAGAGLVGVVTDPNYAGLTVQAVLTELALRQKSAGDTSTGLADRITKLETEDEEEVYEAVGGETQYLLAKGRAKDKTVRLAINGQLQTPTVNFDYIKNASGEITGFNFAPETLNVTNGVPDVLFVQYKKVM